MKFSLVGFLFILLLCSAYLALPTITVAQTASVFDGLARKGFIGVQVSAVPDEARAQLKLAEGQGLSVRRVDPGGAGDDAGVVLGDVILKINDAPVGNTNEFVSTVRSFKAGDKFQLTVLRQGKELLIPVAVKPRPLETHPDFDIEYRAVQAGDARRRVIVTKPKMAGRHPAVLMVGGIGCYSLDNLTLNHAYAKILYTLTQKGFVTMRVEKSGMGDSEGAPCASPQVDLKQEVAGYVAGLRALKNYDFVDADKTFIFGHSIGGIVGPLVAGEVPVSGIVVAETVGTNWFEYALENYRRQAVLRGESYTEVEAGAKINRLCKQRLWLDGQTPEQVLKENPNCADYIRDPAPYTYVQQLTALNLAEEWKKVNAPTLIIYGSSDFLTSSGEHRYLHDMINAFQPGRAAYVEIEGMDHYFERAASQKESLEARNSQQPNPPQFHDRVLDETLRWLTALTAKS